jgi:hypothetical protein
LVVGNISVNSVVAHSKAAQKALAFDPINFTDGIEASKDSFPDLMSLVWKRFSMSEGRERSAEGETRTPMARAATPSRWCVYQFHHFGMQIYRKEHRGILHI